MIRIFFYSLILPILSIVYLGLALSAVISMIAGILRTIGFEQIKMSIWHNISLPVGLSIPFSLVVSFLLIIASIYIKQVIKFFVSNLI